MPPKLVFEDEAEKSDDEVEEIEPRNNQKKNYESEEEQSEDVESKYEEPVVHGKQVNYNTGKSSSSVSQYPSARGFYENVESPTTMSPYQKYSFQGTTKKPKYLGSLISTAAPFNPAYNKYASGTSAVPLYETQSTEHAEKINGCKKLKKHVSHDDAMNCYVCEDPSNKSKYTQCSYSSEPKPLNYFQGKSERYSTPAVEGDGFRYKRYSDDKDDSDPYEYVKRRSQQLNNKKSNDEDDFSHLFQYDPSFDTESKSYSEQQSEEVKKNPENCKKVDKDGMTCTICKNSKTGGNFEQCSYTSEPKDQKYAYVTNKKYNSNDEQPEEEETKTVELKSKKSSDKNIKPASEFGKKLDRKVEPVEHYEGRIKSNTRPERNDRFSKRRGEETKDNLKDKNYHVSETKQVPNRRVSSDNSKESTSDDYSIPQHFIDNSRGQEAPENDDGYYTEDEKAETKEKQDDFIAFDDFHHKLFPESEESKKQEQQAEYTSANSKHDVEEVLAEFSKKDRSNCKKAEKKGMTCYLCVDKHNIQHEECMYVSEPQKSHKAYHEVQKLNKPNQADEEESESKQTITSTQAPVIKKKVFKKVTKQIPKLDEAASQIHGSYVKYNPKSQKSAESRDEQVGVETQRVYSKTLGLTLPKYMVEKSEYEREFDAASSFH